VNLFAFAGRDEPRLRAQLAQRFWECVDLFSWCASSRTCRVDTAPYRGYDARNLLGVLGHA
jgi:hypothetical protein